MTYANPTIDKTTELKATKNMTSEKAFESGNVYQITGWKYWCIYLPIASFIRLYFATLRFEIDPEEEKLLRDRSKPRIYTIWHNRSLLCAAWMHRFDIAKKTASLISPSKMAAWQAAFFKNLGYTIIRGSSSRRSIQSTRELLKAHSEGEDIGIAPDGPSGPLYSIQRGVIALARRTDSPIVFTTANCKRAIRLKSWDKHLIPLPFAKITLRVTRLAPFSEMGFKNEAQAHDIYKEIFSAKNIDKHQ